MSQMRKPGLREVTFFGLRLLPSLPRFLYRARITARPAPLRLAWMRGCVQPLCLPSTPPLGGRGKGLLPCPAPATCSNIKPQLS